MSVEARLARIGLIAVGGVVAITAVAGGAAMVAGSLWPSFAGGFTVPDEYLDGSPFDSFLIPGLLLAIVVGGTHALAFVLHVRRARRATFWSAVAAFGVLIWIFVQMIYIPFSFLQALYFASGIAEAGLVMLALGVLEPMPRRP